MKRTTIVSISIIILIFLSYISYCCYNALWLGDDITYAFNFKTGELIDSLNDIIISQDAHYLTVNGRYAAHTLIQIFIALLGRNIFIITNSLVYILFLYFIVRITKPSFIHIRQILFLVSAICLGFQTKYVPTCQINYIWMFTLSLAVLWLFQHPQKQSKLWCIFLIPFALIAGNGHEGLNIGLCGAFAIYVIVHHKKISFNQWCIVISFCIGCFIIIISPASKNRLDEMDGSMLISLYNFIRYSRIFYFFIFIFFYALYSKKIHLKTFYIENEIYFNSMIILILMNFYISIFSNRQLFGIELMSLILSLKLLSSLSIPIQYTITGILLTIALIAGYKNIIFLQKINTYFNDIQQQYEKSADGIVYYDLPVQYAIFKQTYPCDALRNSRLKNYKKSTLNQRGKTLVIQPVIRKEFLSKTQNGFIEIANGHFIVFLTSKNPPNKIVIKRTVEILGIQIANYPSHELSGFIPFYKDENIQLLEIFDAIDTMPWIKISSIDAQ